MLHSKAIEALADIFLEKTLNTSQDIVGLTLCASKFAVQGSMDSFVTKTAIPQVVASQEVVVVKSGGGGGGLTGLRRADRAEQKRLVAKAAENLRRGAAEKRKREADVYVLPSLPTAPVPTAVPIVPPPSRPKPTPTESAAKFRADVSQWVQGRVQEGPSADEIFELRRLGAQAAQEDPEFVSFLLRVLHGVFPTDNAEWQCAFRSIEDSTCAHFLAFHGVKLIWRRK